MTFRGGTDNDSRLDGGPAGPVIYSGGGNLSHSGLIPVANEGFGDTDTMPSDLPEAVKVENYPIPFDAMYGPRDQDMMPTLHGQNVSRNSQEEVSGKRAAFCSLSKKGRWIAIITLAAIVIASIVGGLVGGLTNRAESKQHEEQVDEPQPQPTQGASKDAFMNSQIAAINFTD